MNSWMWAYVYCFSIVMTFDNFIDETRSMCVGTYMRSQRRKWGEYHLAWYYRQQQNNNQTMFHRTLVLLLMKLLLLLCFIYLAATTMEYWVTHWAIFLAVCRELWCVYTLYTHMKWTQTLLVTLRLRTFFTLLHYDLYRYFHECIVHIPLFAVPSQCYVCIVRLF